MSIHDDTEHREQSFLTSRVGIVLLGFLAVAGFFLFTEHRAHVPGALVWLPLLLCPLMHLFMHHGHSGHSGRGQSADSRRGRKCSLGPCAKSIATRFDNGNS